MTEPTNTPHGWLMTHAETGRVEWWPVGGQEPNCPDGWVKTALYADARGEPAAAVVEAVALALCQNALGGKKCPCSETGNFACAASHPGQQARAAIAAMPTPAQIRADALREAATLADFERAEMDEAFNAATGAARDRNAARTMTAARIHKAILALIGDAA